MTQPDNANAGAASTGVAVPEVEDVLEALRDVVDPELGINVVDLMHARDAEADDEVLGDAVVFAGVAKYPARIKCALLGWMAWKDATARALVELADDSAGADPDREHI